jgi:hypothetical protein
MSGLLRVSAVDWASAFAASGAGESRVLGGVGFSAPHPAAVPAEHLDDKTGL